MMLSSLQQMQGLRHGEKRIRAVEVSLQMQTVAAIAILSKI
jgi:hypothetical protein